MQCVHKGRGSVAHLLSSGFWKVAMCPQGVRKINDQIQRVGTRKSLRTTKKTLRVSEIEKERIDNTCDSDDDVITVEPSTPPAPRPNRVRESLSQRRRQRSPDCMEQRLDWACFQIGIGTCHYWKVMVHIQKKGYP